MPAHTNNTVFNQKIRELEKVAADLKGARVSDRNFVQVGKALDKHTALIKELSGLDLTAEQRGLRVKVRVAPDEIRRLKKDIKSVKAAEESVKQKHAAEKTKRAAQTTAGEQEITKLLPAFNKAAQAYLKASYEDMDGLKTTYDQQAKALNQAIQNLRPVEAQAKYSTDYQKLAEQVNSHRERIERLRNGIADLIRQTNDFIEKNGRGRDALTLGERSALSMRTLRGMIDQLPNLQQKEFRDQFEGMRRNIERNEFIASTVREAAQEVAKLSTPEQLLRLLTGKTVRSLLQEPILKQLSQETLALMNSNQPLALTNLPANDRALILAQVPKDVTISSMLTVLSQGLALDTSKKDMAAALPGKVSNAIVKSLEAIQKGEKTVLSFAAVKDGVITTIIHVNIVQLAKDPVITITNLGIDLARAGITDPRNLAVFANSPKEAATLSLVQDLQLQALASTVTAALGRDAPASIEHLGTMLIQAANNPQNVTQLLSRAAGKPITEADINHQMKVLATLGGRTIAAGSAPQKLSESQMTDVIQALTILRKVVEKFTKAPAKNATEALGSSATASIETRRAPGVTFQSPPEVERPAAPRLSHKEEAHKLWQQKLEKYQKFAFTNQLSKDEALMDLRSAITLSDGTTIDPSDAISTQSEFNAALPKGYLGFISKLREELNERVDVEHRATPTKDIGTIAKLTIKTELEKRYNKARKEMTYSAKAEKIAQILADLLAPVRYGANQVVGINFKGGQYLELIPRGYNKLINEVIELYHAKQEQEKEILPPRISMILENFKKEIGEITHKSVEANLAAMRLVEDFELVATQFVKNHQQKAPSKEAQRQFEEVCNAFLEREKPALQKDMTISWTSIANIFKRAVNAIVTAVTNLFTDKYKHGVFQSDLTQKAGKLGSNLKEEARKLGEESQNESHKGTKP